MKHEIGRPRVYTGQSAALPQTTVRLTYWHIRAARRLGSGNVSEGVRLALERAAVLDVDTLAQPVRKNSCLPT